MLILTRKPGESLYIGDDIKITIVELKGNQIRVGIDAPQSYRIYREEIYIQILEENRQAALGQDAEIELPDFGSGLGKLPGKKKVAQPKVSSLSGSRVKGKQPEVVVKRKKNRKSDD